MFYSVLKASTGSFLAALLDGITLAIKVSITLNSINPTADFISKPALKLSIFRALAIVLLIGKASPKDTITPTAPDTKPINPASAIKIRVISFLRVGYQSLL